MKDSDISAGALIYAKNTGNVLLVLRNGNNTHPFLWSMVSGHIKKDETILTGLKREIQEELSINPNIIRFKFIKKEPNFYYYNGFVENEFKCKLDDENLKYGWFNENNLPFPLYPNLIYKLKELWNTSEVMK